MTDTQNAIQDAFFNQARKDRFEVTIFLVNGYKLKGRIRSFDKFTVLLEDDGHERLIFKHAISTVFGRKGNAPLSG